MKTIESMPQWARIYLQFFDRKYEFDPETIEAVLDMELGEWSKNKLIDCIRWMAGPDQSWPKSPNAKILAIAYKKFSRGDHGSRITTKEGFVNYVKTKMADAENCGQRWNIMCSPDLYARAPRTTTPEECDTIYAWARTKWADWHRPTVEEIESFEVAT